MSRRAPSFLIGSPPAVGEPVAVSPNGAGGGWRGRDGPRQPGSDGPGERPAARSLAAVGLFVVAAFAVLRIARPFFMPVAVALLLALMLRPAVRFLGRFRVPETIGAALVLALFLGGVGYGISHVSRPASRWLAEAPSSLSRVERKLRELRAPVEQVSKAAEEVERIARVDDGTAEREVEVRGPDLSEMLLSGTRTFVAATVVTVVLLYFLLAYWDLFLRKVVRSCRRFREKRRAVRIARDTERQISVYLSTIFLINAGLGVAVGLAMGGLEMPNPVLWGVMAGLLNFVPYLGAMVGVAVVALVGLLTFDAIESVLLPPLVYLALTSLEGQFVTPTILGRRLSLNPVVIFVWLVLWGWMWGVPGALLAVPMLAALKIACDHVESARPLGEFLSR